MAAMSDQPCDPPALRSRRSLPPGAEVATEALADGWPQRRGIWPKGAAAATPILFLGGRADFIEKYAESYWIWRAAGHPLAVFDWRGQGLSGRFGPADSDYFGQWCADLAENLAWTTARFGRPPAIVAHSMGAHIALRFLADRPPLPVAALVALSPMVSIRAPLPLGILKRLTAYRVSRGEGDRYVPMHGPYGPRQRGPRRQRLLTADAARFADEDWWISQTPALALGGATHRWLCEAIASCRALVAPGVAERIAVPVTTLVGSRERLVDASAAKALTARIAGAHFHSVEGAAHELLRETDAVQAQVHRLVAAALAGAA
jgi:lysophospholipase